ncbi:PKD domain-containing protein [Agrococcus beijingensis]|uniref:PKD domain-containing protein n=1 Tax=Agrococcus beijingensis TaxID=3068634 RepID=UPI002741F775|nr:hypothetical protein [Agrococcus sp. REN33]
MAAQAALAPGATNHPVTVGPTDPVHGFPTWYEDANGVRLEGCLQVEDPLCAIPADEVPDPFARTSWPDNFPLEHFYFLAGAELSVGGGAGRAVLTTGLEATFNTEAPVDGEQVTFGRVRIVVRDALPNTAYTFTHPYGVDTLTTDGTGSARLVEDVGIGAAGDFTGALRSRVGPFLTWTSGAPEGYIGDPDVLHDVTGSVWVDDSGAAQNYFRAVGGTDDVRTDLFSLSGRYATNAGLDAVAAVYNPTTGTIDVHATSQPGEALQVKSSSLWPTTPMASSGTEYYARVSYGSAERPQTVTVVNAGDVPVAEKVIDVTDAVTVSSATFTRTVDASGASSGVLTVIASSTDPLATLSGVGAFLTDAPPARVTVTSDGGGSDQAPVVSDGPAHAGLELHADVQVTPATAGTLGTDPVVFVAPGATVTLDGTGSLGDVAGYAWTTSGGVLATDTGSTTSFTAPAEADRSIVVTLTVSSSFGASATAQVTIVTQEPALVPSVAAAGPDQRALRGAVVTLDGSASVAATGHSWSLVSGPAVALSDATAVRPTFTMPDGDVVLRLTTTGADGTTSTDEVAVSVLRDVVTVTSARLDTRKSEWRIDGTVSIPSGNQVTVRAANGVVLGTAIPDAAGDWRLRTTNTARGSTVIVTTRLGALEVTANVTVR